MKLKSGMKLKSASRQRGFLPVWHLILIILLSKMWDLGE